MTTDISLARSSPRANLSTKLSSRPEAMEHACSEYPGRGEIILRQANKTTNQIDGSLGSFSKKDLMGQGASKEEAYIARKMS